MLGHDPSKQECLEEYLAIVICYLIEEYSNSIWIKIPYIHLPFGESILEQKLFIDQGSDFYGKHQINNNLRLSLNGIYKRNFRCFCRL